MSQEYWEQHREDIFAYRDYARSFDLAKDKMAGRWLAESGHQLLETAFQLMFLGCEEEAVVLAKRARDYYEASLASESTHPETDPQMASVFQRLYYARWWTTGNESEQLIVSAAKAFCSGLTRVPSPENARVYQRAALLWLEAGDVDSARPWISLFQQSALLEADPTSLRSSWNTTLSGLAGEDPQRSVCSELSKALRLATVWGHQTAGTLWDALQIANVHRRWCAGDGGFPTLLLMIR